VLLVGQSLERLLYVWSVRHPACGYVQGMNDLATPFMSVFFAPDCPGNRAHSQQQRVVFPLCPLNPSKHCVIITLAVH
jgi:hypothetical protein